MRKVERYERGRYEWGKGLSSQCHVLAELLTPEQAELLVGLLEDVQSVTGYGAVEIVISEKRIVQMKAVRSYRTQDTSKKQTATDRGRSRDGQ